MAFGVKIVSIAQPTMASAVELLEHVEDTFAAAQECLYRARNEIRRTDFSGNQVVIKSFRIPRSVNRFVYAYLRKSKARRSYENTLKLQQLKICTPAPIGYKEVYRWGLLAESYYVSAYVPTDSTLEGVLHRKTAPDRQAIMQAFGQFVCQLHEQGVLHRDLSPGNVLVDQTQDGYTFYLVDTNRMCFAPISQQERYKNFAMLWAKDEDLEVIINAYALIAGLDATVAYKKALRYSQAHKRRSARKEKIKRWLGK